VSKDCTLKLASFGLAFEKKSSHQCPSHLWYASPESLLINSFTEASDLWSAGCIHGELLTRQPVFPGRHVLDMLKQIISALGFSYERDLTWVQVLDNKTNVLDCIRSLNPDEIKGELLKEHLDLKAPAVSEVCRSFLQRLLIFNPQSRPSAVEALTHEYFENLHGVGAEKGEKTASHKFSLEFEASHATKQALQDCIYAECAKLHPWIAKRDFLNEWLRQ